jgi:hypothetical protein
MGLVVPAGELGDVRLDHRVLVDAVLVDPFVDPTSDEPHAIADVELRPRAVGHHAARGDELPVPEDRRGGLVQAGVNGEDRVRSTARARDRRRR